MHNSYAPRQPGVYCDVHNTFTEICLYKEYSVKGHGIVDCESGWPTD